VHWTVRHRLSDPQTWRSPHCVLFLQNPSRHWPVMHSRPWGHWASCVHCATTGVQTPFRHCKFRPPRRHPTSSLQGWPSVVLQTPSRHFSRLLHPRSSLQGWFNAAAPPTKPNQIIRKNSVTVPSREPLRNWLNFSSSQRMWPRHITEPGPRQPGTAFSELPAHTDIVTAKLDLQAKRTASG